MNTIAKLAIGSTTLGALAVTTVLAAGDCCASKANASANSPVISTVSFDHHNMKDIVDTAVGAGQFKTLAAALGAADLVEALKGDGPFTVFAPTDAAFAKLPAGTVEDLLKPENKAKLQAILKYHVVKGEVKADKVTGLEYAETLNGQRVDITTSYGKVKLDDKSTVTATDIGASNGVIHVIDTVIMPETKNVVEVAEGAEQFTTLLAAVEAAGLTSALVGEGPFTILAPTDAAFSALPTGTVENLLRPENRSTLQAILQYHVISGRVYSDQVVKLNSAETLGGETVSISTDGSTVRINESTVVKADIEASNGVIHVIDAVLLP